MDGRALRRPAGVDRLEAGPSVCRMWSVIATAEDRYRLLLQLSEAVNAQLDLGGVLEELANVLVPLVDVDGIGIVTVSGDRLRPHAIFIKGVEARSGESPRARIARALELSAEDYEARYGRPMPVAGSGTEQVGRAGRADACEDLLSSPRRFEEDDRLRGFGVRSYVRAPLIFRERLVGSLTFARVTSRAFTPEETALLEEISRPIAGAVSNALAFEEIARLKNRLQEENLVLRQEIDEQAMFEEIVGSSSPLRQLLAEVEKVAPTDATVLITGETGTGKELVARAIHRRSPRAARSMIKVNLASLPDTLVASELFGHEKGAFTGALQRRVGRFELANGGTIFLDEVGELPADVQVALLRVLQEGEFERVGGNQTIRTTARVIAATNRDLALAIEDGAFRSDLFFRLNVFPLTVPPLRDRRDDIPILVEYFVARHGARLRRRFRSVDRATLARLMDYSWPGNIRELENVIERASILAEGDVLRVDERMLASGVKRAGLAGAAVRPAAPATPGLPAPGTLRDEEVRVIEEALAATRGRVAGPAGAAARLGIPATTLESKLKKLGIDKFKFRSPSRS
jgi:formate hydrogenlyase transcriptional activator